MKNVMKNILLLCCLMGTASTLIAMQAPIKQDDQKKPLGPVVFHLLRKKADAPVQVPAPTPVKPESDYDKFLKACQRQDFEAIKQFLISQSITSDDIKRACHTISHVDVKIFLKQIHDFLYTDAVHVLEEIFSKSRETLPNPFIFFGFIPRRFEIAVAHRHVKIIEYLLNKYSQQIGDRLLEQQIEVTQRREQEQKRLAEETADREWEQKRLAEEEEEACDQQEERDAIQQAWKEFDDEIDREREEQFAKLFGKFQEVSELARDS